VYYLLHDPSLDRTTNGTGLISETGSKTIDTLDAGSWFGHKYAHEKVPRLRDYLQWVKGKANVYFDVKDANLKELVGMVDSLQLKGNCFFWFSDWQQAKNFRTQYPEYSLKINASSVDALDSVKTIYNPQIVECSVDNLSEEFIAACHKKGMKVMPCISGNDMEAYRTAIVKNIDLINLDNPAIFSGMQKNNGEFKGYKLIAHRGGVTEGKYNEYDPASILEAIDRKYYMLEIDVRMTKDGVLMLNHNPDFSKYFNNPKKVSEMTWDEIKELRSAKGNFRPLSLEELAQMCSGKIEFMLDLKEEQPSPDYYQKLGEVLKKYDLLSGAYFIDYDARKYFWGKAKFNFRVNEVQKIREELLRGEDVACHYFLFDNANRLNSEIIKWCQQNSITVVPSVNTFHYQFEDNMRGAKRDIEFLKECGVTEFQVDSQYDQWLPR
jgi:glycerophosphoryl diester phosphodiesterase